MQQWLTKLVQDMVKPKTPPQKKCHHQPSYQCFEEALREDKTTLSGNSTKRVGTPVNAATNLPTSCQSDAYTIVTVS